MSIKEDVDKAYQNGLNDRGPADLTRQIDDKDIQIKTIRKQIRYSFYERFFKQNRVASFLVLNFKVL